MIWAVRVLAALLLLACAGHDDESEDEMLFRNMFKPRPNVVAIEPTKGPWKNNPQWGNSFDGPFPAEAGAELPIFEAGEIVGPPRVQSLILYRNEAARGANSDVFARVFYGIGAKQDSFDLDYLNGVQFSLVCNWVRVVAVSFTPEPLNPYSPTGGALQLGAGVAEGTVTKGLPASFTEIQRFTAPGVATFEMPPFAKSVIVWGAPAAAVVQFIGGGSFNPFTGTVADFDPFLDTGIACPGGMVRVIVTPAADCTIAVQWFLGL